uniref:LOW QUALITY PROTEIN: IgGFc-binding protein-like n=1 Tax=Podarcis muralis TaxID=64176 RepID=UPI00109F45EA|nr:LOW QUALITY PROTEIN: IgGFc-binding protein-like [Podarcis muralis]
MQALEGYCGASTCGKEFVTAFLKNYLPSQHNVSFELLITGYQLATTVTVTVNKSTFQKMVSVNEKETVSVVVPASSEMRGSNVFDQTVQIQADKNVSVFSVNYKAVTSAATVVYPVQELGTLYYVVTPAGNHTPHNFKEFAVVAHKSPTRVIIHLKGAVTFQGKVYPAGSKLVVDLKAFQAIQLQSSVDLSGTKVESVASVAVLSGHSCAMQFTTCDHVVEQLLPVTSWGTNFIVPTPLFLTKFDIVYVIASQNTLIKYHSGTTQGSRQAKAGQVIQFKMQPSQPLYFTANAGIQVLFFYTGVKNQNIMHESFLINIPAFTSYCTSYRIGGIRRFANFAVVIAKTSVSSGIRLEKKVLTNTEWRPIPGTEYSFAQLSLGRNASAVSVEHPSTPFGLLIFGVSPFIGIGSTALCSCAMRGNLPVQRWLRPQR